jgi:hypothetical protein
MRRSFNDYFMSIGSTISTVIALKAVHVSAILIACVALVAAAQREAVRTFEEDRVGVPPGGFVFSGTAPTRPDRWLVRREHDNNVLAHLGDPDRTRGNAIAILEGPRPANLTVSASFKLAAGDGPGGFVWRYQDPQNYYMVSLDLADVGVQELGLYRVVRGNRIRIGREEDLQLRQQDWHVLRVVHAKETIKVYLSGIKVFEVQDRTFRDAGAVGLWSAADASMYFDNLSLREGERR